jgi:TolA-binding protein
MRKVLLPLAAAASVFAIATPASAQWASRPTNGYARGNGAGNFQRELQQVRVEAQTLRQQGRLTRAESNDLNQDIRNTERTFYMSQRNGMSAYEVRMIQGRIVNLQREVRRYADYDRSLRHYRRY